MSKRILILTMMLTPALMQAQSCPGASEALDLEQGPAFIDHLASTFYTGAIWGIATITSRDQQAMLEPIFKRASYKTFDSKTVTADLLTNFTKRCNKPKLDAYLAITKGDTFKAMMKLEAATLKPTFLHDVQMYAATTLAKNRPSDARIGLITRFDKAVQTTDCVMSMFDGGNMALKQTMGLSGMGNVGDIETIRDRMWQQVNLMNVYIFRDASDTELLSYIKLMEQPAARWFHLTYTVSVTDVMRNRMPMVVQQIMEGVQSARR